MHRSIWRARYVPYSPSRLACGAAGSDVERDAAPLPTPLRERDASSTSSSLLVSEWRAWARDRAKATSEALPATSDLPSVESLFTEIDWIIEDAVVGQRRGSTDEPPAPWSIAEIAPRRTKTDDDDDDDASARELVLRESVAGLRALWNARLDERVPLQYLTSTSHWRDLVLVVTPATLIPRPETERMVDFVADALRTSPELARAPWADLGTGSGALAIAVARELREVARRNTNDAPLVHAVDVDPAAIAVATENARRCLRDESDIALHVGSWFEPLDALGVTSFGGIVSNPPYIPSVDVPHLQPEVVRHEPKLALDGGDGAGTKCVDDVVAGAATRLKPGGFLLLETNGGTQAEQIARSLRECRVCTNADGSVEVSVGVAGGVSATRATNGSSTAEKENENVFEDVAILRDFCGVGRFVSARRKKESVRG